MTMTENLNPISTDALTLNNPVFDSTEALLAQRGSVYGDAVTTHARIAEVWSGIIGIEVTAFQVALCMVGLKLVRASNNPGHGDSLDDAKGYTVIAERIAG